MAVLFDDLFNGTAGTNIEAHVPDVGTGYTIIGTLTAANKLTGTGQVYRAASPNFHAANPAPPNADYTVALSINAKTLLASDQVWIYGRCLDTANFYYVRIDQAGVVTLGRAATAGSVTIGTYNVTQAAGTTHVLELVMAGSRISARWDGVELGSGTDTALTATGLPAFRIGGASTTGQTTTTGLQGERLTVSNGESGNTTPPAIAVQGGGSATTNSVLTVTQGAWSLTPGTITDVAQISTDAGTTWTDSGSFPRTLTATEARANARFRAKETAAAGTTPAYSNVVQSSAAPLNTAVPSLSGTIGRGQTVTVVRGSWDGANITYTDAVQRSSDGGSTWQTAAAASTYVITQTDEGKKIRPAVMATNSVGGQTTTAYGDPVDVAAIPAMAATDLKVRMSGGTGNSSGAASIGGAPGAEIPFDANLANALFGTIPGSIAQAGGTLYRGVYLTNDHPVESLVDAKVYVANQYDTAGLQISVGPAVDPAVELPTLASGTTAPPNVTFTTTTNPDLGPTIGSIPPTGRRAIWVRLTVAPATYSVVGDQWEIDSLGTPSG